MVAIIVIAPVAVILMHTVPATAVAIIPMAVIIMAAGPVAMIVMMAAIAVVVIVSAAGIRITVAVSAVPIPWRIAITDADAHRPAVDATVAVIAAPVVITAGGAIAIIVITLARVVTAWRGVIPGIRADIFRRHDAAAQEQ